MSTKEQRIIVFRDTMSWIRKDEELTGAVEAAGRHSTVYYENEYPAFDAGAEREMEITVTRNRTFQAAMMLRKEFPEGRIAVLNFANAFHPGGGVVNGAGAQEECLCRCSTLYPVLNTPRLREEFYGYHHRLGTPKASDALIYSRDIAVIKTDTDLPERMPREDRILVDVITAAAPDLRPAYGMLAEPAGNGSGMEAAELFECHVRRAKHILTCAAANGADILVLGAFGCGAFRNDPRVVANAFRTAVSAFPKVFRRIEFAVYCPDEAAVNYRAFREVLEG